MTQSTLPDRIGPYRIEGQIATGGMGAVYRAYDERLARPVALKRIRDEVDQDEAVREQLLREARAIAQLSHPNIVQVFDLLEHDKCDWIVMELVDGLTLREILASGVLDVKKTLIYAMDVTRGLAAAHARGIVHRDLKTENVMVSNDGRAKILDFGLAHWDLERTDLDTTDGKVQGTPRSMSPEQARCEPADHRADFFSLGVLIYECLTDISPFQVGVKGLFQVLSQICTHRQQSLSELSRAVPQALSDLVDNLLEKDRDLRPQSADDVLLALQRIHDTPDSIAQVLFVDDEPDFEELIRQRFRKEIRSGRMQVSFAQNGQEALECLQEDPAIQLVFTDLNMPVMDGLTLIHELFKQDRNYVTVVISAYGDMGNIRAAMNAGAFDFLTKPLSFKDLATTLEKATKQAAWMNENSRLMAENQLLDERNRFISDAFSRYLQGDPNAQKIFDPVLKRAEGRMHRNMTLVTLEMSHFDELPRTVSSEPLFRILDTFFADAVATVQRHEGTILEAHNGRLSVGFGMYIPREIDGHRAMSCAVELRQAAIDAGQASMRCGGPELAPRIAVDSGELLIQRKSREISGPLKERSYRAIELCSDGQILTSEATLSQSGIRPKAAPVRKHEGNFYELDHSLGGPETTPTIGDADETRAISRPAVPSEAPPSAVD